MNGSVYPIVVTAVAAALALGAVGCSDNDIGEARKQIKLARLEGQLQDEKKITAHKTATAQLAGIRASKTVADAVDSAFGSTDSTSDSCGHNHRQSHRHGTCNGQTGVTFNVYGTTYIVEKGVAYDPSATTDTTNCGSQREMGY